MIKYFRNIKLNVNTVMLLRSLFGYYYYIHSSKFSKLINIITKIIQIIFCLIIVILSHTLTVPLNAKMYIIELNIIYVTTLMVSHLTKEKDFRFLICKIKNENLLNLYNEDVCLSLLMFSLYLLFKCISVLYILVLYNKQSNFNYYFYFFHISGHIMFMSIQISYLTRIMLLELLWRQSKSLKITLELKNCFFVSIDNLGNPTAEDNLRKIAKCYCLVAECMNSFSIMSKLMVSYYKTVNISMF